MGNTAKYATLPLIRCRYTILIFGFFGYAEQHGRLIDPPGRGTMWRLGFDSPANYNDHELFCGGFSRQWIQNKGRCGECGDPWDLKRPRPNEHGGTFGTGSLGRVYRPGEIVTATVHLTANHFGWFEFRLCPVSEESSNLVTQKCLNRYVLKTVDHPGTRYTVKHSENGLFRIRVQLPPDVTCDRCVLQWHYTTGNNWGFCLDGKNKAGCGPQEVFRGCADIGILTEDDPRHALYKNLSRVIDIEKYLKENIPKTEYGKEKDAENSVTEDKIVLNSEEVISNRHSGNSTTYSSVTFRYRPTNRVLTNLSNSYQGTEQSGKEVLERLLPVLKKKEELRKQHEPLTFTKEELRILQDFLKKEEYFLEEYDNENKVVANVRQRIYTSSDEIRKKDNRGKGLNSLGSRTLDSGQVKLLSHRNGSSSFESRLWPRGDIVLNTFAKRNQELKSSKATDDQQSAKLLRNVASLTVDQVPDKDKKELRQLAQDLSALLQDHPEDGLQLLTEVFQTQYKRQRQHVHLNKLLQSPSMSLGLAAAAGKDPREKQMPYDTDRLITYPSSPFRDGRSSDMHETEPPRNSPDSSLPFRSTGNPNDEITVDKVQSLVQLRDLINKKSIGDMRLKKELHSDPFSTDLTQSLKHNMATGLKSQGVLAFQMPAEILEQSDVLRHIFTLQQKVALKSELGAPALESPIIFFIT